MNNDNAAKPSPELLTAGTLLVAPRLLGMPKLIRRLADLGALAAIALMFLPAQPAVQPRRRSRRKSRSSPRRTKSHHKDPLPKAHHDSRPGHRTAGGLEHVEGSGSGPMEGIPGASPVT